MEPIHPNDIEGNRDNIFNMISIIFATVAAISTLSVAYILIKKRKYVLILKIVFKDFLCIIIMI